MNAEAPRLAAPVLYYRLRQVGLAGTGTLSPVRSVAGRPASGVFNAVVFPNPWKDVPHVQLTGLGTGSVLLALCNVLGRRFLRCYSLLNCEATGRAVGDGIEVDTSAQALGREQQMVEGTIYLVTAHLAASDITHYELSHLASSHRVGQPDISSRRIRIGQQRVTCCFRCNCQCGKRTTQGVDLGYRLVVVIEQHLGAGGGIVYLWVRRTVPRK